MNQETGNKNLFSSIRPFRWCLAFCTGIYFCLTCLGVNAQTFQIQIQLYGDDAVTAKSVLTKQNLKPVFKDSVEMIKGLTGIVNAFYKNGFLTATINSLFKRDSLYIAILNYGKQFKWAELKTRPGDDFIIDESGVRLKLLKNKTYSPNQVSGIASQLLKFCENNGYPFARVMLENVITADEKISATLAIEKNQLIKIDSIIIEGTSKLSLIYLYNFISVKPGDLYNESLIRKISTRMRELPFVSQTKSPLVKFSQKGCQLFIFIDQKKSNQFDGVLGVMPSNNKDGKTIVTGELRMRLLSAFNRGELIDLNWKQPQPKTQDLKLKFSFPFLFKSPFGVDAGLNVYKKDTSYFDVNLLLGLNFYLSGGDFIKVFVNRMSSSLLSTSGYQNINTLPPYADIKKTQFGISARKENLDYRYNPRNGYSIEFIASVGKKVIEQNPKINESVYDSIKLNSTNYELGATFNYYFPDRKSTRLNSSHVSESRMPSSA